MPALLAAALLAAAPLDDCEVTSLGRDGLRYRCPGDTAGLVIETPKSIDPKTAFDSALIGAAANMGKNVKLEPIELTVAGKKHPARNVIGGPTGKVAKIVVLDPPEGARIVLCVAPDDAAFKARCAPIYDQLAAGKIPEPNTRDESGPPPYTQRLFGGDPKLPDGCSFDSGNQISCGDGSRIFWGKLRSPEPAAKMVEAMKKAVPPGITNTLSARDCTIAGVAAKCQVLDLAKGSAHHTILLGDAVIDGETYRVECRFAGTPHQGPAPAPCGQVLAFSTALPGDVESRDVRAVVFAKSLPAGTKIAFEHIQQRALPASLASKSVVPISDAHYVVGSLLGEDVEQGEPAHWAMFLTYPVDGFCDRKDLPAAPKPSKGLGSPRADTLAPRTILVAAKDLEVGAVLTDQSLAERAYPSDLVGAGATNASARKAIVGEKVFQPMLAGDPVRWAWLEGYGDHATRCRFLKEEFGNVFEDGRAPPDLKGLACPAGTTAFNGVPAVPKAENRWTAPGWVFECTKPDGTKHGPFASWSRKGIAGRTGAFNAGKKHGAWKLGDELLTYKDGVRDGPSVFGTREPRSEERAQFKNGYRDGPSEFLLPDGKAKIAFKQGVPGAGWVLGAGHPVVVAARPIPAGQALVEADLAEAAITDGVAARSIVTPDGKKYVLGQKLEAHVAKGAPLFWSDFDPSK